MEATNNKQLCCPCCGSKELAMTTDRDISGAVANGAVAFAFGGAFSGIASAASNLQQQTFWVCKKCGKKFRNPLELKNEADIYQKRFKILMTVDGILGVLSLILAIVMFSKVGAIGILFLFFGVLLLLLPLVLRGKASRRYKELKEIEDGMSRFR